MGRTSKLPRYDEFNGFDFCFGERQKHDNKVADSISNITGDLIVELGCGKAELSLGLAEKNPDNFYIGVDRKSDRMWRGAKTKIEKKLENIAFIQTDIRRLQDYLGGHSLDAIWITFPDPYPRDRHEKHRMVNKQFIDLYRKLLKPGGEIFFKTDDDALFEYFVDEVLPKLKNVEVIERANNLHESNLSDDYKITTTYEKRWISEGKTVKFIRIKL